VPGEPEKQQRSGDVMTSPAIPRSSSPDAAAAVECWTAIGGPMPSAVRPLQEERQRVVYRLVGGAPDGRDLIAKCCPRSEAEREQMVYTLLSSHRPQVTVELYGTAPVVTDSGARRVWLFLQDAGGRAFRLGDRLDRAIAGRWLAELHVRCADLPGVATLRDRGPDHFVEYLKLVPDRAALASANPELSDEDRCDIARTTDLCARVRSRWDDLAAFCASMPSTFVFGDFKDDNLRVVEGSDGLTLVGFDWNEAGWGVAALDVLTFEGHRVAPLLSKYLPVVTSRWPDLTAERVLLLGVVGEIFRCAASMRWDLERLEYPWTEAAMSRIRYFNEWMDYCMRTVPWFG
jgi:hypothetical protein